MKMTKQVKKMVESFNDYLSANKIKDEYNETVLLVSNMLFAADCYDGFNWFDESGKTVKETDENAVIQFYITD